METDINKNGKDELAQFIHVKQEIAELTTKCGKVIIKCIEEKRKEITKPILEKKKEYDKFAKDLTMELGLATGGLRTQIKKYAMELEKARQAKLRIIEAEKQAKLKELEDVDNEVVREQLQAEIINESKEKEVEIQHKKTGNLRSIWKYEVVDIGDVFIKYLMPDDRKIKEAIKDGERNLSGIRIYEEKLLNLR